MSGDVGTLEEKVSSNNPRVYQLKSSPQAKYAHTPDMGITSDISRLPALETGPQKTTNCGETHEVLPKKRSRPAIQKDAMPIYRSVVVFPRRVGIR